MLLSIPREIGVPAGLPENACVRASAFQGGLLCGVLTRDTMRPGCRPCLCFAMVLSPAKSQHAGQPLDSEVALQEEHLCQLLIILMG